MRTAIVGAVASTKIILESLIEVGVPPLKLFTLPESLRSRHSDFVDLSFDCANYNIPISFVDNINHSNTIEEMKLLDLDYLFVIGWSQICSKPVIDLPNIGCIGYHPALLPQYRGRAVIPWTILKGLKETGGTMFFIDEGMDSGDIIVQEKFSVDSAETATSLYKKHELVLEKMALSVCKMIKNGPLPRHTQKHDLATYCARRTLEDGYIDWQQPAATVLRLIRAVGDPYPGAFSFWRMKKITIWTADYSDAYNFVGIPGQIQQVDNYGAVIQCGDARNILLKSVQIEGQERCKPGQILKRHDKLGLNIYELLKMVKE